MNSLQLIQSACRAWLVSDAQGSMDASSTGELLRALNLAQGEVWRQLPPHYKRQKVSWDFYGPAQGYVTPEGYGKRGISGVAFSTIQDILSYQGEPIFYEGEPLLFNGQSVYENPRPYCSILVDGDGGRNQFNGTALVHPYLGQNTTSSAATLYHDSMLSPVMIERIVSPIVDLITGAEWRNIPVHEVQAKSDGYGGCRNVSLRRILYDGHMRTLIELAPLFPDVAILEAQAHIAPVSLTLGSAMRAVDLPYDDETAGLIISMAGPALSTHALFDKGRVTPRDAFDSSANAARQLSLFSPTMSGAAPMIGTPQGW